MTTDGASDSVLAAIRQAFAKGKCAEGEVLFAEALEAGLPWDMATRAVADGVTQRFAERPRASEAAGA